MEAQVNNQELSPEYRMAYMNNILCYYILRMLESGKQKGLADEIYETAKQMAFGDILKEKEKNGSNWKNYWNKHI